MAVKRRVGLAGLGSIGRRHARLLLERSDVELEVTDPSPEAVDSILRDAPHIRAYPSFEVMLANAPDVVWIASPTEVHASQSTAALRAGAHVFCEKPVSDLPGDAAAVRQAAEVAGRVFNVGFVLRFAPVLAHLRRLIAGGSLGNLVHLHARVGSYVTLVNSRSRYQSTRPGSLFFDYSHQPDIFYWLTGLVPSTVRTVGLTAGNLDYSSDPNAAVITYEYNANLVATLHLNYVQMPERHEYEVAGDEGWVHVSLAEGRIVHGRRNEQELVIACMPHDRDDLFRAQQQAFFDAVDGRCPPSTSAREGLIAAHVCDATLRSWQTGDAAPVNGTD